jgi:agmatinase
MAPQALPHGFLERPLLERAKRADLAECDVVVLGVPFDLATTGRAGARAGPAGIRQASWHMSWEKRRWPWRFALADRLAVVDAGDIEFDAGDTRHMIEVLRASAHEVLAAGKTLLSLGGDHFISLPLLREHAATYGQISLVHFDAHADTEPVSGAVNHGNMFRQALAEGLVDPTRSVQIGIRTEYAHDADYPFTVLDAVWVGERPARETARAIEQIVGEAPAYLTFDIDCLDPAYAPGTGTPVPGGLETGRALDILRGLVGCNLVGMDVVEVAPAYDHAELTCLAGATIAMELLHVLAAERSDLAEVLIRAETGS